MNRLILPAARSAKPPVVSGAAVVLLLLAVGVVVFLKESAVDEARADRETVALPYDSSFGGFHHQFTIDGVMFTLLGGSIDPQGNFDNFQPHPGNKLLYWNVGIEQATTAAAVLGTKDAAPDPLIIRPGALRLRTDSGVADSIVLRVNGVVAPVEVPPGRPRVMEVFFDIPIDAVPLEIILTVNGKEVAWTFTETIR